MKSAEADAFCVRLAYTYWLMQWRCIGWAVKHGL